jgi:hypothetical protein
VFNNIKHVVEHLGSYRDYVVEHLGSYRDYVVEHLGSHPALMLLNTWVHTQFYVVEHLGYIGYAGVTVMVLNATFKQQYFSYIVTDSGHSRHRRATTKKNKEKHTQKTKTMSNTNHHKTGCEPRCTTPGFTPSFMLLNTWVHTQL